MTHHRTSAASLAAALLAAATLGAPALHAQSTGQFAPCAAQGDATDACQKAADLFAFLAPQISASIAGGNATLGQGGTMGGLGRFALTIRASGLPGELPNIDEMSVSRDGVQRDQFGVDEQWFAIPQVDLAVGLFGGIPLGLTSIGGVDVLLSGSYIPELDEDDFSLGAPDGQFKLSYGARLGILKETIAVPGVAVSYMRRELPTMDIVARPDDDLLSVSDVQLRVDSWRLTAGKRFPFIGLAAGIGQDRYDSQADVSAVIDGVEMTTPVPFSQEMTRTNAFANVAFNLAIFRLVGEVGRVWGGDVETFNTFENTSAAEPRLYGSVGLRFGF